jgi:regulator of sigma E protease
MIFLITAALTVLIIGFLVFIHELGHFVAARLVGVKVKEFSIGFGKSLVQKKRKETIYKIGMIPLGGYVQLEGEDCNIGPGSFRAQPYFSKLFILVAGVLMNFLVAIILFTVSLFSTEYKFVIPKFTDFQFTHTKDVVDAYPVTLADISPNSVLSEYIDAKEITLISINNDRFDNYQEFENAFNENIGKVVDVEILNLDTFEVITKSLMLARAEDSDVIPIFIVNIYETSPVKDLLQEGDQILAINGILPRSIDEFNKIIAENEGKLVSLEVLRNKESVKIEFQPVLQDKIKNSEGQEVRVYLKALLGQYKYGYSVIYDTQSNRSAYFIQYKRDFFSGLFLTYDLSRYQFVALSNILSNAKKTGDFTEVSQSFGGVAQVGDQVSQVVELRAFSFLLPLTALISLALATFNIIPFPALDGGQVMVITVESLIRKPIPDRILSYFNNLGFIILIILGILITVKDFVQLGWFSAIGINL